MVHGQISSEITLCVAATTLWEIYRGTKLSLLTNELLPDVMGNVEVLKGDGDVGTLIKVTLPAGTPPPGYVIEKFTRIDDKLRLKEAEIIEGVFHELGFLLYRVTLELIEDGAESTILKSIIEYKVKDEFASNAAFVTTASLETMAKAVEKYLIQKGA